MKFKPCLRPQLGNLANTKLTFKLPRPALEILKGLRSNTPYLAKNSVSPQVRTDAFYAHTRRRSLAKTAPEFNTMLLDSIDL